MTISLARFFSRWLTRKPAPTPEIDWREKMREGTMHMGPQPTVEAADRARRATKEFEGVENEMRVEMENESEPVRPNRFSMRRGRVK